MAAPGRHLPLASLLDMASCTASRSVLSLRKSTSSSAWKPSGQGFVGHTAFTINCPSPSSGA